MSPATYPPSRSPSLDGELHCWDDEASIPLYHDPNHETKRKIPELQQSLSVTKRLGLFAIATALTFAAVAFFWSDSLPPLYSTRTRPPPHASGPVFDTFLWQARANAVRDAYIHAYDAYEKYAFPRDELLPLSKGSQDNFNGWGVTTIDSIDTFLLMGLKDKYYDRALAHVKSVNFSSPTGNVAFFETTIRYLGGLLSAYAMTREETFKLKADELGELLLHAFETNSGLPAPGITASKAPNGTSIVLAEMSTFQMEFKYLAHITGKKMYYQKAEHVNKLMQGKQAANGFWSDEFGVQDGNPTAAEAFYTMGGGSDSAYEYLLKQYLLSNKTETRLLEMYLKTSAGAISNTMYISPNRHLLWQTDLMGTKPTRLFHHLACFFPGLLALGVATIPQASLPKETREKHLWTAQGLTETCYLTYADHRSGLGAESVVFRTGNSTEWEKEYDDWAKSGSKEKGLYPPGVSGGDVDSTPTNRDYQDLKNRNFYILRPEVLESMYLMYRITGSQVWRERAWEIFKAIEKWSKVSSGGYASMRSSDADVPDQIDDMPSYFLAETLKYLYLMFHPDPNIIRLDEWVFNTEAHPLPVFQWSAQEIVDFGIGQ